MGSDRQPPETAPKDDLGAVGALAEPHRRALYDFVVGQREWVGREQAAAAVGLARGIASHHLDRLADEGLLEIDYRRLNDRRGPGAGRPAKVYRRAPAEIAVNLPPRDYELAGRLLADAAERSERDALPIGVAIDVAARSEGKRIAGEVSGRLPRRAGVDGRRAVVLEALGALGFEPAIRDDDAVVLHNCPFHQLAQTHTQLICGMNLCLLDSVLHEVGGTELRAELEPEPGCCCVRMRATG